MGNLSFEVTREELIEAFSEAGKVVDAKVPTDRETGRPRGFAFVQFESEDAAQRCISMLNGRPLRGRPLRVNEAEDRPPRAPGMGPGPSSRPPGAGGGVPFRPSPMAAPPPDFMEDHNRGFGEGRGRSLKNKGSRRNIRRRKRGFDFD